MEKEIRMKFMQRSPGKLCSNSILVVDGCLLFKILLDYRSFLNLQNI